MNTNPNAQIQDEINALQVKINNSALPSDLRDKANGMILRLQKMAASTGFSSEFEPVSEYINWITQIPWGKYVADNLDLNHAEQELNSHHYGLQPVKTRILEYLAILNLQQKSLVIGDQGLGNDTAEQAGAPIATSSQPSPQGEGAVVQTPASAEMQKLQGSSSHAPILCFVGIQGVGKTSMAKSISTSLGRQFMRIALGGLGGVSELRGRSRGETDAEPGQIIKALIRTGSMNPVILLDEIDKVSSQTGLRSDVMASLLEILDPEQNSTFVDKYLDYPVDLSKCIFITTANNLGGISAALLDRLEVIRFGSYNDNDKVMIAKNFLLPKVREATGITEAQLSFDDNVWPLIIRPMGFDAGVRQLERTLTDLARKVAFQIVKGTSTGVRITEQNFRQFIPEEIGIFS